jgi:3-hydroxyacyl-[acyl-carrier-protein] dehydratase
MVARRLAPEEILAAIPHQKPFRFIDAIRAIDDNQVCASYRFRNDADFYRGHFPDNPITPGVILIETMAQAAVVAHGIYLLAQQASLETLAHHVLLFSDAQVEFCRIVRPDTTVVVRGRKRFFRLGKLASDVEMTTEDGRLVCRGVLSGMGVQS